MRKHGNKVCPYCMRRPRVGHQCPQLQQHRHLMRRMAAMLTAPRTYRRAPLDFFKEQE